MRLLTGDSFRDKFTLELIPNIQVHMTDMISEVVESFYLETTEGLFFAVKGMVHPPDRFLAVLRYVPDASGDRQKEGRRYRRLYHFAEQERFLESQYPQYLAYDNMCQVRMQSTPRQSVIRIFDPRKFLQALRERSERDPVEEDALAFTTRLQLAAGIPWDSLGISGSLLIGLHISSSDLDLTVHGAQNCKALHHALRQLLHHGNNREIRSLDEQHIQALYAERGAEAHTAFTDFREIEKHKVFQGQFRERTFFIRFLKYREEIEESYGQYRYTPLGKAEVYGTVSAAEAIFTPCRYELANVRVVKGPVVERIAEIVSYRGRFCEQAQPGDLVQVSGTLERIQTQDGRVWHRLLLGNDPEDRFQRAGEA